MCDGGGRETGRDGGKGVEEAGDGGHFQRRFAYPDHSRRETEMEIVPLATARAPRETR